MSSIAEFNLYRPHLSTNVKCPVAGCGHEWEAVYMDIEYNGKGVQLECPRCMVIGSKIMAPTSVSCKIRNGKVIYNQE